MENIASLGKNGSVRFYFRNPFRMCYSHCIILAKFSISIFRVLERELSKKERITECEIFVIVEILHDWNELCILRMYKLSSLR